MLSIRIKLPENVSIKKNKASHDDEDDDDEQDHSSKEEEEEDEGMRRGKRKRSMPSRRTERYEAESEGRKKMPRAAAQKIPKYSWCQSDFDVIF